MIKKILVILAGFLTLHVASKEANEISVGRLVLNCISVYVLLLLVPFFITLLAMLTSSVWFETPTEVLLENNLASSNPKLFVLIYIVSIISTTVYRFYFSRVKTWSYNKNIVLSVFTPVLIIATITFMNI